MVKYFITLLTVLTISCQAQTVPLYSHVAWEHDYTTETGSLIDSVDVEFIVLGASQADSLIFYEFSRTQEKQYYILQHEEIYADSTWYWSIVAHRLSNDTYSQPSDTVSAVLRKIGISKVYELKTLSIPIKK